MTRARAAARALLLAALGFGVAVGILSRVVDEMTTFPGEARR